MRPPQQRRQWEIKPKQPAFSKKNCTYTQLYFNLFTIYFIFCISGFIIVHCRKYIWIFYWTLIIALLHLTRHFTNHTYSSATWHPSSIILWLYHQESHTYRNHKYCNRNARNFSHADDACVVAVHLAHPLALLPLLHRLVSGLDLQGSLLSGVRVLKSENTWEWGKKTFFESLKYLISPLVPLAKNQPFHFAM